MRLLSEPTLHPVPLSRRSPRAPRSIAPFLAAALLIGLSAGAIAVLDPFASVSWRSMGLLRNLASVPYLLSLMAALLAVLTWLTVRNGRALVRRRHFIAVGAVMVTSHLTAIGKGPLNPLTAAIGLLIALWILERLTHPKAPWSPGIFVGLVVLFVAWMLVSTLGHSPADVFQGLVSSAPKVILALLLLDFLEDREIVRWALHASLWVAGAVALAGLVQVALSWIWGFDISMAERFYRYAHVGSRTILRATAFSRFANQFAPPLVVACLIAMHLLPAPAGHGRRLRLLALVGISAAAVGFSMARGSWTALAIGVVLLPWMKRPERSLHWLGLVVAVLAVGLATGLLPKLLRSVHHLSESGMEERTALLGSGLQAIARHPWTGVGIGNFGSSSPTFERPPVHNAFLQVGSELGVPGLLVYVLLLLWVGLRLALAMRRETDPVVKSELGAFLAGLTSLLVVIQAEPMGYSQFVWIYLALTEAAVRHLPSNTGLAVRGT